MLRKSLLQVLALAGLMLVFTARDKAQTAGPRAVITQAIDESRLVTLVGNTRREANKQNDLGPVRDDLHLDMYLQLKRSPEQELAAAQFVESLTDKASPNFHKWITAAEYGQRFGAASEDIATVSRWLESHGFTVNGVPANNMVIDFSGDAGQVREALHTEIHTLDVAGKRYFANMSDPQIPAALLPAVAGVVSLNNFKPHPMLVPVAQYTVSSTLHPVVPGDLATIYNLNPAFSGGFTGKGQTIVVVEDTDLYNGTGDWSVFRSTFGLALPYPYGSLTQVHPAPGTGGTCSDPGINGDDGEAAIDVEWASAAAPNAAIVMASCTGTTNFGGFIALQNLLTNGGPLPSVVSISYGESETESGAALNSYINTLYQTAAAAGVSVFVSSGDSAAAASDRGGTAAIYGIGVSGWASTIYNVAVGGTDFGDYASGTTTTFWNSTNGTYYNSAKSYVPEIPWIDSCGSVVAANYYGFSTAYGATGFCNAYPYLANTVGGSGGPSGCATGARAVDYAASGTCAGYGKPSWQSIFGNPSDGVRDLPDVALFASNGFWGHYYVVCFSAGASCAGAPSTWAEFGGTSVSSPIMAGIQALINQALGSKNVGNPNPVYYQIGAAEYSTSAGRTACNSTTGPASTCSFNDVTQGDMVLPCAGAFNCYLDGMALGVLSTSDTSYAPAFAAAPGWDFATGIGTVNAFNLLNAFVDQVGSLPDLVVTSLTGPNYGNPGGAINISSTVLNQGTGSAGAFQLEFYFSPTSNVSLSTAIDTGWGCGVTGLAPGASLTCSGPIGVPASLTPGTWYLAVLADPYNQVVESNKNNNWRTADTGPVTVGPILKILGAGSNGYLYSIVPTTGATTLIGPLPTVMSDIAAYNGFLYGVSFTTPSVLYNINPNTGAGTVIGSGTGAALNALVFSSSGTLYAAGGDSLYTINTSTAYAALIGSGSGSGVYQSSGDLAFDYFGNLYLTSVGSSGDQLFSLNPATGQGKLIGNIGSSSVYGLAYFNSTLYGFTLGGQVLTINVSTGVGTTIASYTPGFDGTTVFVLDGAGAPVLSISKAHTGNFTQGQAGAMYTVTVSNAASGGSTSGLVTVTETVPSGLSLVSMAGTGWTCVSNTCTRSDALAAGSSYAAITVTVNVAANATSPQVNAVSVSGGGSGSANTTDSTTIIANPPVLRISKTHTGASRRDRMGRRIP